ncbi:MAG: arylsulfatase, partial [Planctomycetota bacterium]
AKRTEFVMRSGSNKTLMTIQKDDWKLITGLGSGGFSKPSRVRPSPGEPDGQLYNLKTDLGETTNVYEKHPEIVLQLQRRMDQVVQNGRSR